MHEGFVGKVAIVASVGIHLVIAMLFWSARYDLNRAPVQKLIEIRNFGVEKPLETGSNIQRSGGVSKPAANPVEGRASSAPSQKVNLPDASATDIDDNLSLPTSSYEVIDGSDAIDDIGNTSRAVHGDLEKPAINPRQINDGEDIGISSDNDWLNSYLEENVNQDADGDFTISGEVTQRDIIEKVLPEYPEGLQQVSDVVLQFEVNPDGTVGDNILALEMGGPELLEVSKSSLRKWRFSAINGSTVQTGVIKFKFKLE